MLSSHVRAKLEELRRAAKDEGVSLVACLADYSSGADFSTALSLWAVPSEGVTEDHVLLDALREIQLEWHAARHESRLEFVDK